MDSWASGDGKKRTLADPKVCVVPVDLGLRRGRIAELGGADWDRSGDAVPRFRQLCRGLGRDRHLAANPPARISSGGVVLLPSGSWSGASFSVTGDPAATYAITLPGNGTVALTSGANTMAVNSFTSSPASTGQLGAGGSQTLSVGATLSVGNNQASGTYSGSFVVTVEYN